MNIGNSGAGYEESKQPNDHSLQLNLLPPAPVALKKTKPAPLEVGHSLPLGSKAHLQLLWQSLRPGSYTASAGGSQPDEKLSFATYRRPVSVTGIDVNQIPAASTESEDHDSPASSTSSPLVVDGFQKANNNYSKRERQTGRPYEINCKGENEEERCSNPPKKLRLLKGQITLLEERFKEHSMLNLHQKQALAKQLRLKPRQVEVWFQNRRARTKLKQTEADCELLKRYCENLTEENKRLKKELQELRAIRISAPCVISAATKLALCPSCKRLSTVGDPPHRTFSSSRINRFAEFSSAAC